VICIWHQETSFSSGAKHLTIHQTFKEEQAL
jgi:hypothetical protein